MRSIRTSSLTLATVLVLAVAAPAAAGTKSAGFIAGFSYSNLNIQGSSGLDGRGSFAGGGVLDLGVNDKFGIRIEPTFVSKGAKATHRNAYFGSVDGVLFDLNYIDVPVLARFDLPSESKSSHGFALGGVAVGFATKQEAELSQGSQHETVDFGPVFSSIDVNLDLGLGLAVPMGANCWTFDGRAAIGVMNINNGGTVTFQGNPLVVPSTTTHTLGFRLLVTYLFALK